MTVLIVDVVFACAVVGELLPAALTMQKERQSREDIVRFLHNKAESFALDEKGDGDSVRASALEVVFIMLFRFSVLLTHQIINNVALTHSTR